MDKIELSHKIKLKAAELKFDACGIARAAHLEEDAVRLENWLLKGMQGSMHYMENHFEKRVDPRKLMEGARSVIAVLLNYYPEVQQKDPEAPVISKYAYGQDYHFVIKKRLKSLLKFIQNEIPGFNGRAFVDSAPVLDRAWAFAAGIGWIGKNSMLISPRLGSFVFIGTLIVDVDLEYDKPIHDMCGGCTKCLTACPTNAILPSKVVDGSKCISYFTIENKDAIPENYKGKFRNRAFGCDICQDVCPWNRKATPHHIPELEPPADLIKMTRKQWFMLDKKKYSRLFKNSALKRAKYEGLVRNFSFIAENNS